MRIALVYGVLIHAAYTTLYAVIVTIVYKQLKSLEILVFYGKTMF